MQLLMRDSEDQNDWAKARRRRQKTEKAITGRDVTWVEVGTAPVHQIYHAASTEELSWF